MQHDYADNSVLQRDLEMLESQLQSCKQSMRKMMDKFSMDAQEQNIAQPVNEYMAEVLERWRLMRPDIRDHYRVLSAAPAPLWGIMSFTHIKPPFIQCPRQHLCKHRLIINDQYSHRILVNVLRLWALLSHELTSSGQLIGN